MVESTATEYPAMLEYLQPTQAVHTLNDRVKRVSKLNIEIADWLQERRKVEEQYVQGLRRLTQFKTPNTTSELGTFRDPWDKILHLIESVASSHRQFATRIETDVEHPLRNYGNKKEVHNMQTIGVNLASVAKELEDAQDKSDKLARKGVKASTQKVDAAATRLSTASQQWESQAPFIFESLQVLDEQRVNELRDLLTQFLTHESDQAQRTQAAASETLQTILEIDTATEIHGFSKKTTDGKMKVVKKPTPESRRPSAAEPQLSRPTTASNRSNREEEAMSETSGQEPPSPHPRLRSRIGTMIGRRRQSIHGGFGPISQKSQGSFGRNSRSSHGRSVSPRESMNDLSSSNKLPSLAEKPGTLAEQPELEEGDGAETSHERVNGVKAASSMSNLAASGAPSMNGNTDTAAVFDPPPGPPPSSQAKASEGAEGETKDAEGFTIPPVMNDPISQAQREAHDDAERLFKLNIQSTPVPEDDPVAAKAALSNVTSALQLSMPSRKGTVRGRRDVRNTIYVPAPNGDSIAENVLQYPSSIPSGSSRSPAVAALTSEASIAGTSDTQSVRSGASLGTLAPAKHPETSEPGLNASIIEMMTATFEDGAIKTAKMGGEIALCYNPDGQSTPKAPRIRINNFPKFEVIGPNRIFVHNGPTDRNDEYTLDVSHLAKTSTAFTYRIHTDSPDGADLATHAPLLIRPVWKPRGDRLELLMQYSLNPASGFASPLTLHNVVIFATYEGARASGAQTKPSGTHLKDRQLVYWRLGVVTLTHEPQKIVCRIVGAEKAEPKPGHVEARWEYSPPAAEASLAGISISRLQEDKGKGKEVDVDDPFADADVEAAGGAERWVEVPTAYRLVSGKYEAR